MSQRKQHRKPKVVPARQANAGAAGYTLEFLPHAMPYHPDLHNPMQVEPPPRREVMDEPLPPQGTPEYERWHREWCRALMWGMAKYGHGDENDDEPWEVPPADDGSLVWGARYRYLLKPFTEDGTKGHGD